MHLHGRQLNGSQSSFCPILPWPLQSVLARVGPPLDPGPAVSLALHLPQARYLERFRGGPSRLLLTLQLTPPSPPSPPPPMQPQALQLQEEQVPEALLRLLRQRRILRPLLHLRQLLQPQHQPVSGQRRLALAPLLSGFDPRARCLN